MNNAVTEHDKNKQQRRITADLTAVTANPKNKPMAIWKKRLNHMKMKSLQVCGGEDGERVIIWKRQPLVNLIGVLMLVRWLTEYLFIDFFWAFDPLQENQKNMVIIITEKQSSASVKNHKLKSTEVTRNNRIWYDLKRNQIHPN